MIQFPFKRFPPALRLIIHLRDGLVAVRVLYLDLPAVIRTEGQTGYRGWIVGSCGIGRGAPGNSRRHWYLRAGEAIGVGVVARDLPDVAVVRAA